MTALDLFAVCEATWPPARAWEQDGWILRDGAGGGKRVSAATRMRSDARIVDVEVAMRDVGQQPLFMIRDHESDLDTYLEGRGYQLIDPVTMYLAPVTALTDIPIPPVTAFTIWEPLAIMTEIWAQGGIGPARLDVMARAQNKTAILGRWNDTPAGVAFAAIHDGVCMVHAVEVIPTQRRQGVAGWMMRKAAFWALDQGALMMAVLCTDANKGAVELYRGLGMKDAGHYHYRLLED